MQVCKSEGLAACDVALVLGCSEREIKSITGKTLGIGQKDFITCLKRVDTDDSWRIWEMICDNYVAKDQLIAYAQIVKNNSMIEDRG